MVAVVQVTDFRKVYGSHVAVDGISFQVERGEIFGLLGPNGAGKTSTLESLEGLRRQDGGSVRILDVDPARDVRKVHNLIGVQLQTSGLPGSMCVDEAMSFFCAYRGVAPRFDLLQRLGLGEKLRAQYLQLSTGQKRRLALALAVAHNPPVVFLDEPTAGIDAAGQNDRCGVSGAVGARRNQRCTPDRQRLCPATAGGTERVLKGQRVEGIGCRHAEALPG